MQLTKSVTLPSGIAIGYWDITLVMIDSKAQTASITLSGYIDQAHYDGGAAAATSRTIQMGFAGLTGIATLQAQVATVLPDLII